MKGLIFSIKKYSVHDGPGIRVTFFLKGCPLNCRWCHNPEGISPVREKLEQVRCIGNRSFSESVYVGEYYDSGEIMRIVKGEDVFIRHSGGGVTFSGGEPMLQPDFLISALKVCSENGYHTAIDTSGFSTEENFRAVLPFTDLFLFDLKHLDEERHVELTGSTNKIVLANYSLIMNSGKDMILRIPVIPGYNDEPAHLNRLRSFIGDTKQENLRKICLLPFHRIGSSKYKKIGMRYMMENTPEPSTERMAELKAFFEETGIKVKIGG